MRPGAEMFKRSLGAVHFSGNAHEVEKHHGSGLRAIHLSRLGAVLVCLGILVAPVALADGQDDAEQLKEEAKEVIRANSNKSVPPKDYAMAIYRLEKAQSILEAAHDSNSALAQEVNTQLFWARRCSNVNIIKELDKIHAENPPLKLASQDPKA